jgi:threonine synthase
VLDPHSAIGYLGAKQLVRKEKKPAVFLATAHPAKFPEIVERVTGREIDPPDSLKSSLSRPKNSILIANQYDELKSFLSAL